LKTAIFRPKAQVLGKGEFKKPSKRASWPKNQAIENSVSGSNAA
jgi:hypothetical protein